MKNSISSGEVLDYTNGTAAAIKSGDVVVISNVCGVANTDIAIGATGSVDVEGAFSLPKAAGLAIAQGDKVYWDATNKVVTKTNTDKPLGFAFNAALAGDAKVDVSLSFF